MRIASPAVNNRSVATSFSTYLVSYLPCSKNHQRALDAMQLSLEAESRNKVDAMRVKKKLEQDINDLELTLDGVNKAKAETERNFKKYQQQIRDLQQVNRIFVTLRLSLMVCDLSFSFIVVVRQVLIHSFIHSLWPPYEIGRPLYFCPVVTIFLSFYLSFFLA